MTRLIPFRQSDNGPLELPDDDQCPQCGEDDGLHADDCEREPISWREAVEEVLECERCGRICPMRYTVVDEDRAVGYRDELRVCVNCVEGIRR